MRREWHPSTYTRFGETLHFFFVEFYPVYERAAVFRALQEILSSENLQSFAFYEVFGRVDLVLKAWLPSAGAPLFERVLREEFERRKLAVEVVLPFQVQSTPFHWLWPNGTVRGGTTGKPNHNVLDQTSVAQILEAQSSSESGRAQQFVDAGLLKTYEPADGIRFFITVPSPRHALGYRVLERLVQHLSQVLKDEKNVQEAVLYRGTGPGTTLLIEGLVRLEQYRSISKINSDINAWGIDKLEVKTTTLLAISTPDGIVENEARVTLSPLPESIEVHEATYYLTAAEGPMLEHKGSFELDIMKYLATGETTRTKNSPMIDEVLKTIVAFLNSKGGELIIGALEDDRIPSALRPRVAEFPIDDTNNMQICGINWEYNDKGWDGYSRRLTDMCAARIGESYASHIIPSKLLASGRDLCLIQVLPLPTGQFAEFAYLDGAKFFVRAGASTIQLSGEEQERYQRRRYLGGD